MNIPRLPTDSLYKFITLFGLVLMFLYFYFSFTTFNSYSEKEINLNYEIDLLNLEVDEIQSNHERLLEKAILYCEETLCCEILNKDLNNLQYNYDENKCDENTIERNLKELIKHDTKDEWELLNKSKIIEAKSAKLDSIYESRSDTIDTITWLLILGVFLTAIGFILWYIKIQRYQDVILKKQANEEGKEI